jgi:hypothetical protein
MVKACLRVAAVLAFLCFFAAGALLLGIAAEAHTGQDRIFPVVLGLFFVGTACFAGPLLFAVGERFADNEKK